MKRVVLLLSVMLMGLGMQVRADIDRYKTITLDGIKYQCRSFMQDFYTDEDYYAVIYSGKDAEGDVVIPDTIYDNGISYPVRAIGGCSFMGNEKITRLKIASTVRYVQERAFAYCTSLKTVIIPSEKPLESVFYNGPFDGCNLDTMVVDQSIARIDLWCTSIENLYIESNDTAYIGASAVNIGNCYLSDIDQLVIDCDPFGTYLVLFPDRESYYSVKAVSVEAVEPPTVEKQRYSRPEDMKLCWTVLFVPDGSEEKYRQAEFWKDFYCIKPLSEMNRYDEFVAEANAAFSEWAKEYLAGMDNITKDINDCTVEGDQLQFTSTAEAEICDLAGRALHRGTYTAGESLTLPKGVSIVTVNGHCFKVAVK